MNDLPYVSEFLAKDGSLDTAVAILFPKKIAFVDSMRLVSDLIVECQAPGQTSDENPGIVGRTVALYIAASNYCKENGGSIENWFPKIACDFNEMKTVKFEGEDFRDVTLYKHLN